MSKKKLKVSLNKVVFFLLVLALIGASRPMTLWAKNWNVRQHHSRYIASRLKQIRHLEEVFDKITFTQIKKDDVDIIADLPQIDDKNNQRKKYYFRDNEGNFYMFKTGWGGGFMKILVEVIGNHISLLLGAHVVPIFYKELMIDGQNMKGVMVRLVPNSRRLRSDDLKQLNPHDIRALLRNEAIDIFLFNDGTSYNDFLAEFDNDNKIIRAIQIDKDHSMDMSFVDKVLFDMQKYRSFVYWCIWEQNFSLPGFNYQEGMKTAALIEDVPDGALSEVFHRAIRNRSEPELHERILKFCEKLLLDGRKDFRKEYIKIISKFHDVPSGALSMVIENPLGSGGAGEED